jgi:hypothetical protein
MMKPGELSGNWRGKAISAPPLCIRIRTEMSISLIHSSGGVPSV